MVSASLNNKIKPILIAGPTASGKSSLALALADRFDGVIINADSCQVYRELRILSARPSDADEALVSHRLYGHCSGGEAYSTGKWLKDIEVVLGELANKSLRPIIVGGTGLYFKCLTEGLSIIPDIDKRIREFWRGEAKRLEAEQLYEVLQKRDPLIARELMPTDSQRIVRALEVIEQTGKSLKNWREINSDPLIKEHEVIKFVVTDDREILYERINKRLEQMVDEGAIDEVRQLKQFQFDEDLPIMRALGVPEFGAFIDGNCKLEEAILAAKQQTRRYAKRQLTWLRRNMIAWNKINAQQIQRNSLEIFAKIDESG